MFESRYENNGLANSRFTQDLNLPIKPKEFQSFWSVGSMSGAPGPKSALRDTKSITFAKGFFQLSNL